MGVVHMLVVALVGITYGWQSDNNGGVEYIVQISPTELGEIRRLGEITSSIDPQVAGRVSRIKIQVGSGTLPRETPASRHAQSSGRNAKGLETASDRMAVPIPKMRELSLAAPIRSPDNRSLTNVADRSAPTRAAVMKPDPDNAGPIGFQFPSTSGNAAGTTTDNFRSDTAATTNPNPTRVPNGTLRIPAPSTRPPDPRRQPTLPQFTGANSANVGGPTTDPTNRRDQTWSDFAAPRTGGPTTDNVGTNRSTTSNPQLSNPQLTGPVRTDPRAGDQRNGFGQNTASTAGGSSNRNANGTFGQAPGAMTFPARGPTTEPRLTLDRSSQPNSATNQFSRGGVTSQQQQTNLDRQDRTMSSREFAAGSAVRDADRQLNDQRFGNQSAARTDARIDSEQGPDRRLTNAELEAGAWSIDRYGRLLDRTGRLIPPVGQNDLARGLGPNQNDRYTNRDSRTRLEQPMIRPTNSNVVGDIRPYQPGNNPGLGQNPYQQPGIRTRSNNTTELARNGVDRTRIPPQTDPRQDPARDPVSLTKREASPNVVSATTPMAKTARKQIAAQPLFNGLLLMSFVANIYLMFWLKNLRLRFRDLVAAKRLTGTANPAN